MRSSPPIYNARAAAFASAATPKPQRHQQQQQQQRPEVGPCHRMSALAKLLVGLLVLTQSICHYSNAHQLNLLISNASTAAAAAAATAAAPEVAQQVARPPVAAFATSTAQSPLDLEPIIQTISTVHEEPAAKGPQEPAKTDETTTKKNSELPPASSPTEGATLINHKEQPAELASEHSAPAHESNELLEDDDLAELHQKTSNIKNRRHADNYLDAADWWTRSSSKPSTEATPKVERVVFKWNSASTASPAIFNGDEPYKRVVYQEQPVSQNPILTVKNQLATIESQRKLLVSRSIKQLYQLDTRLIDSYKTYMKKKQPLYAGMLYSTRGFVIKMAKEVKQSKNVLDSMSKQVQGVLKQKMANRTLVREYNKLTGGSDDADESRSLSPEPVSAPSFRTGRAYAGGDAANELYQAPRKTRIRYTITVHEANLKKQLGKIQALVDRINGSTYELNMVINDINYLFKIAVREPPRKVVAPQPQPPVKEPPRKEAAVKTTKFIQELDKHSPSTYNSKLGRKSVKSPIRIFMEKYGKLKADNVSAPAMSAELVESSRSSNNVSDNFYTPDLPELQPLFDASSFVYTEPKDLSDLGFDHATNRAA